MSVYARIKRTKPLDRICDIIMFKWTNEDIVKGLIFVPNALDDKVILFQDTIGKTPEVLIQNNIH